MYNNHEKKQANDEKSKQELTRQQQPQPQQQPNLAQQQQPNLAQQQQQPDGLKSDLNNNNAKTNIKVIEIPVHHLKSTAQSSGSASRPSTPPTATGSHYYVHQPHRPVNTQQQQQHQYIPQDQFFNPGNLLDRSGNLFENIQSPFDFLDQGTPLFNRFGLEQRNPLSGSFAPFGDIDDFFRPNLLQQQQKSDAFFNRNSPAREHLYTRAHSGSPSRLGSSSTKSATPPASGKPTLVDQQTQTLLDQENQANGKAQQEQQQPQPQQQEPLQQPKSPSPSSSNYSGLQQQQQQPQQPSAGQKHGVPIPVKFLSRSPPPTPDLKYSHSDFQHPVNVNLNVNQEPNKKSQTESPIKVNVGHQPQTPNNSTYPNYNPYNQQYQREASPNNMGNTFPNFKKNPPSHPSQPHSHQPQHQPHAHQHHSHHPHHHHHHQASSNEMSDFAYQPPSQSAAASTPVNQKSAQEKCDDIANELSNLERDVDQFAGKKDDKQYLKIDEYLTQCLLKLDEIDRSDEKVNQSRRRLINLTQQLSEKLEKKSLKSSSANGSETNDSANASDSSSTNEPINKRPKSPNSSDNVSQATTLAPTPTMTPTPSTNDSDSKPTYVQRLVIVNPNNSNTDGVRNEATSAANQ